MTVEGDRRDADAVSTSNPAALAFCVAALVKLAAPGLTRAAVYGDVNGDGVLNIGGALYSFTCT